LCTIRDQHGRRCAHPGRREGPTKGIYTGRRVPRWVYQGGIYGRFYPPWEAGKEAFTLVLPTLGGRKGRLLPGFTHPGRQEGEAFTRFYPPREAGKGGFYPVLPTRGGGKGRLFTLFYPPWEAQGASFTHFYTPREAQGASFNHF